MTRGVALPIPSGRQIDSTLQMVLSYSIGPAVDNQSSSSRNLQLYSVSIAESRLLFYPCLFLFNPRILVAEYGYSLRSN